MSAPSLPHAGPFRVFPTMATRQRFSEDAAACNHCLGGACCQSEDAIYLTAIDILRLAAFFDLSPAEFLQRFTQEKFAEGLLEPYRREIIDDPTTSVVTYLRRRSNRSFSPCIFLKYVREANGTPRRICAVHPARPLACREYYHHHCKTRSTGELASLFAHAFEMIGDGRITVEQALVERERLRSLLSDEAPMSVWMEYALWTEALRAAQMDEANNEGANSYDITEYQDPIDTKINRLLSKQRVRLEERYGWIPHGEQLATYSGGLSFAGSPEHQRLLKIASTAPSRGLFEDGDYPFFAANRLTISGMQRPRVFRRLGIAEKKRLVDAVADESVFPLHRDPRVRTITRRRMWRAALDAADAFVTFAAYVATLGHILETQPPGTFEWEILQCIRRLEVTKHPVLHVHPGLAQVKAWARSIAMPNADARRRLRYMAPPASAAPAVIRRLLESQQGDGSWSTDPPVRRLSDSQAEYLRRWLHDSARGLLALRPQVFQPQLVPDSTLKRGRRDHG